MKKFLLPVAAVALLASSCSTDSNGSFQSATYYDFNLIIDNENPAAEAQVSYGSYGLTVYYEKGGVEIKCSDLIINNQKFSFETDTMAYRADYFKADMNGEQISMGETVFSKVGQTGVGSAASDLKGALTGMYVPSTTDTLATSFNVELAERLDLQYTLSNRYRIKTFWNTSLYVGRTYAADSQGSLSTKAPKYVVTLNFNKKLATVFVYNSELTVDDTTLPKVIRIGDIPVLFTHDSYYLEAAKPKTTVLSYKNRVPVLIDSVGFQVENFSLRLTPDNLSEANINYRLKGKSVDFIGNSMPKRVN